MKTIPCHPLTHAVAGATGQFPFLCRRKKEFNVCWTIYAGWMPWGAISTKKSLINGPAKYGIKINIVSSTTISSRLISTPRVSLMAAP